MPERARSTIGPAIFADGARPRKKSATEIGPTTMSAARSTSTSSAISPRSRARSKIWTKGSRQLRQLRIVGALAGETRKHRAEGGRVEDLEIGLQGLLEVDFEPTAVDGLEPR
jgi:hypothetical protein